MKKIVVLIMTALVLASSAVNVEAKPKKEKAEVTFEVDLHCAKCTEKIMENISFERGVSDLVVDEEARTVKIVYDTRKTNVEMLQKAIGKLGYEAVVVPAEQAAPVTQITEDK